MARFKAVRLRGEPMKITRLLIAAGFAFLSVTASAQSPASNHVATSHRLLQEYATADNLRAFAIQARARANEGGQFYAYYVANICGRDYTAIAQRGNAAI